MTEQDFLRILKEEGYTHEEAVGFWNERPPDIDSYDVTEDIVREVARDSLPTVLQFREVFNRMDEVIERLAKES